MLTAKESKKLKIGDRVRFNDGAEGIVIERNWMAVKITWDDGQIGVIHHNDMECVERA